MKKELLLMGEVQVKYEEKLAALKYDNQMTLMLPEQENIYLKDIYSEPTVLYYTILIVPCAVRHTA